MIKLFYRKFHFCRPSFGLEEFFSNGKSWTEKLSTGRSWTLSDLRLKSFTDLHSLWYILLKEQNMLATQREEAWKFKLEFNGSERLKKTKESMSAIKFVLAERRKLWRKAVEEAKQKGHENVAMIPKEPAEIRIKPESKSEKRQKKRQVVKEKVKVVRQERSDKKEKSKEAYLSQKAAQIAEIKAKVVEPQQ